MTVHIFYNDCLHELQFLSLQPEDNTVQLRLVLNQDYDS